MQTLDASTEATTIYCPKCGGPMRIAPQHRHTTVACPHCRQALDPWRLAGLAPPVPQTPVAPRYTYDPNGAMPFSWRNRWIAGALGILLGGFGVHRFYLGFIGIGILQIVVTIATFGIVGPIWGFIEGILCFCGAIRDVDGLPLSG